MTIMSKVNINWEELGFDYIKTDLRYVSIWENGKWDDGKLVEDNKLVIEEGAPALHYGQQCFEGLKAYRTKNGDIQLFRPDKNAERLNNSCKRLLMPEVPVENKTGAQLPSTGSKGALMVTLAGIVLFGALTASKAFGKKKAKN